jgi:hypothetical protein
VIRGARPGARRLALFALIAGTVAGIGLGVIGCIEGVDDADLYGRVSVPGDGALELPEGDVALYYESHVDLGENESLDIPDGLRVVARRENTRVRSRKVLQNEISLDGRALREFAKLEIPREGLYRVTVTSRAPGSADPAVTFGKGQLGNLGDTALRTFGPIGAGLGAALLLLLLGRIGYRRPTPHELAAAMPAAQPGPWEQPRPWAEPGAPPIGGGAAPPGAPGPPGSGPSGPPAWSPPPGLSSTPAASQPAADLVEAQLRELEREHSAGRLGDEEYQRRRREVLDSAFRPPGG